MDKNEWTSVNDRNYFAKHILLQNSRGLIEFNDRIEVSSTHITSFNKINAIMFAKSTYIKISILF